MTGLQIETLCLCGCNEPNKFIYYRHKNGDVLGVFCNCCGKEWLETDFMGSHMTGQFTVFSGKRLYMRESKKSTPYPPCVRLLGELKTGDHIRWKETGSRGEGEAMDAIVETITNATSPHEIEVGVIMMHKLKFCELAIGRTSIDSSKVVDVQIIGYNPICDPVELVVSRAQAWCETHPVINLFSGKSHAFSSFCKRGPAHGWRVTWFGGQVACTLKSVLGPSWLSGCEEDSQRITERASTKTKIKAGILFVMDGVAVGFELSDLLKETQETHSVQQFLDGIIDRVVSMFKTSGWKVGGAIANRSTGGGIGLLEMAVVDVRIGIFLGSVLKGSVPCAPQKAVGSLPGRALGNFIHMSVKRSDKFIALDKIEQGSHVILPGHIGHPRCHAIVVSVNFKTKKIKLIRNTYQRGVVEEWVEVCPPVLTHSGESTTSAETVVTKARSKLGENKYNILYNNCKHFAAWCKQP